MKLNLIPDQNKKRTPKSRVTIPLTLISAHFFHIAIANAITLLWQFNV
jgi:hypothetical protein